MSFKPCFKVMMWRLYSLHIPQTFLSFFIKVVKWTCNCFGAKTFWQQVSILQPHDWQEIWQIISTAMVALSFLDVLPLLQIPCSEISVQYPVCIALYTAIYGPILDKCTCSRAAWPKRPMSQMAVLTKNRNQWVKYSWCSPQVLFLKAYKVNQQEIYVLSNRIQINDCILIKHKTIAMKNAKNNILHSLVRYSLNPIMCQTSGLVYICWQGQAMSHSCSSWHSEGLIDFLMIIYSAPIPLFIVSKLTVCTVYCFEIFQNGLIDF